VQEKTYAIIGNEGKYDSEQLVKSTYYIALNGMNNLIPCAP